MSEGLTIFGKTVFDTLFIDYRIMVVVAIISILLFLVGMYIQLSKYGRGIPEGATEPLGAWGALKFIIGRIFAEGVGTAISVLVLDVIFQRREFKRRKLEWLMHILIFWGWVGLLILTIVAASAEFYGPFVLNADHTYFIGVWQSLEGLNDLFAYMLVGGITLAVIRRLFFKGTDIQARNPDVDWILIIGLLIVVVTGFYAQDIRVAEGIGRDLISAYPPTFFNNFTVLFHEVFTLLFCVAYLPFSKYLHIIAAPLVLLVNHGGE